MLGKLSYFNIISLFLGLSFLYLPILFVIIFSFNSSKIVGIWSGFSFYWYQHLFYNEYLLSAMYNSFFIAFVSASCSIVVGTVIGLLISRFYKFPGYKLFYSLIHMPITLPDIIIGISLLLAFSSLRISPGFVTVIIAHTVLCSCYVGIIVQSRLSLINKHLEEAAMDLGCTSLSAFQKVVIPLIIPTLVVSWLMCFAISMDDLVIASFNHGPDSVTLPIKVHSQIKLGVTPEINVIGTITLLMMSLVICLMSYLNRDLNKV